MTTIVPKTSDAMYYLGKPVKDLNGERIGSIIEVEDLEDHYKLIMEVNVRQVVLHPIESPIKAKIIEE
jgi:hypothetical protein